MSSRSRSFIGSAALSLLLALGASPTFAANTQSGIDTSGSTTLPFSIQGNEVMTLYPTGLTIDNATSANGLTVIQGIAVTGVSTLGTVNANQLTATGIIALGSAGSAKIASNDTTVLGALNANGVVNLNYANGLALTTVWGSFQVDHSATFFGLTQITGATTGSTAAILVVSNGSVSADGGFTTTGNITANSGTITASAYYHSSDKRLKTDIHPISNALDKILAIKGVQFNWKKDGRADMGVVAQNVADVFPDVVTRNSDGMMAVEYDSLVGPMIESIRELKAENDQLREQVAGMADLKSQVTKISDSLKALQYKNDHIQSVASDAENRAVGMRSPVAAP